MHRGGARVSRRFYVERPALAGDRVELGGAQARRIATVLRLRAGDEVVLFDGTGVEARVALDEVLPECIRGRVLDRFAAAPEPRTRVCLYQAIARGERFDWLVEKATEVGAARIAPIVSARSVVKHEGEGGRGERWRRIAIEAAEQCGRSVLPALDPPRRFADALASARGVLLIAYEEADAHGRTVQDVLDDEIDAIFAAAEVSVFVGPEGGFERAEVEAATAAGAHVVTLGARTLRSETAGVVAATLVLHAVGEM
jgi:16S rRNA (uracil1498-N3)-methyltransferase